jgi:hypothetical protein
MPNFKQGMLMEFTLSLLLGLILCIILVVSILSSRRNTKNNKNKNKNDKKKKKLEFIHIPKNAGSTIETLGKRNGMLWGIYNSSLKSYINKCGDFNCECSFWHIPPRYLKKNSPYDVTPTFCVIRNPFDRVVSAYIYIYQHRINKLMQNAENLNQWIHDNLERVSQNFQHDCHFIPQYEYLFREDGTPTCDYILNFDNLNNDFNALMREFNINLDITTIEPINKTVAKSLNRNHLNLKSREIILSVYTKDFEIINKLGQFSRPMKGILTNID